VNNPARAMHAAGLSCPDFPSNARFFEMREDQGLAAAAAEIEPSAPCVVMTARGKRMSRVTSAAIKNTPFQAGTYIVMVAA